MPPDRGRASRACASCRKQKTRCYEPGTPGKACLRCERLHQRCSLVQTEDVAPEEDPVPSASGTDARLERLERTVANLLDRLGEAPNRAEHDSSRLESALTTPDPGEQRLHERESSAAPIMVIRDLATDYGPRPAPDMRTLEKVLDDLIAPDLALSLVTIFLKYYGRWITFDPESDPTVLLSKVRGSPLLFCASCLIAVRHTSTELAASLAPKLYECAQPLVSSALIAAPQPIEFFQATLILCMWSTTVGQVPLSIDSWLLSGFALQHCQSSPLFNVISSQSQQPMKMDGTILHRYCLWNHLCLAHLHYCVGTSRRSMLQAWQIERCRVILTSDHAINFEIRMVVEIYLYWNVYEHLIEDSVDLFKSVAALQTWEGKMGFLLMGFHFSNLLFYEHALKSRTARARESVVSEMIRHSTAIVHLAMDTVDERTRHLSDHVYHMITFAAIIICRLLNSYEEELSVNFNIGGLDGLIQDLVQWLHSIGLPCHAAHTLGNIIAKVHQMLRPRVEQIPLIAPIYVMPEESFSNYYFPEFLGLGASADGHWDLLSDQSFFPQSSATS
ncbi:uncharacterized protein N7477_004632 [Penicillium maclennaniae]|uniref:uncharacterized protein n=1 Tax=Penicillium maclennaniae TaxID=1343394 RepID=UPI00254110D5|nr:uncharacterized protein N7477_004632 [Penicillium maclennaniae]KAJ5674698.1 hypothetical protein N7477_004632 [Penicillium maclennaniae]